VSEHDKRDTRQETRESGPAAPATPGSGYHQEFPIDPEQKERIQQAITAVMRVVRAISKGYDVEVGVPLALNGDLLPITSFGYTVGIRDPATGTIINMPVAITIGMGLDASEYVRGAAEGYGTYRDVKEMIEARQKATIQLVDKLCDEAQAKIFGVVDEELARVAKQRGEN